MITSSTAAAAAASTVRSVTMPCWFNSSVVRVQPLLGRWLEESVEARLPGSRGPLLWPVSRASSLVGCKMALALCNTVVPIGGPGLAIHICIPGFFDEVVTNDVGGGGDCWGSLCCCFVSHTRRMRTISDLSLTRLRLVRRFPLLPPTRHLQWWAISHYSCGSWRKLNFRRSRFGRVNSAPTRMKSEHERKRRKWKNLDVRKQDDVLIL